MSGYWDIIIPEASTNLVLNPVGDNTSNVAGSAGTTVTAQTTTYNYSGPYCVRVQSDNTDEGIQYTLSQLPNAIHYASARVRGSLPPSWKWSINTANYYTPTLLATEGDWLVYGYQFTAAHCLGSVRLDMYQSSTDGSGDYYVGHVQVEEKEYSTTPITGDMEGCYWNGPHHASTSTRRADTRAGGRVYDIDTQYGMYMSTYPGIGTPEIERYQTPFSLLPGSLDDGYKVQPREVTLVGEQTGTSWANMHYKRKNLIDVFKSDGVRDDQPVKLRYRGGNTSRPVEIDVRYLGGMEFTDHEGFTSKQALRLRANDPYWHDVYETAFHLTEFDTIGAVYPTNFALRRTFAGQWDNLITGTTDLDNIVWDMTCDDDLGRVYLGGQFTTGGGVTLNRIGYRESTGYAALSTAGGTGSASGAVYGLKLLPNHDLWVVGNFTDMDGDTCDGVAMWDYSSTDFVTYDLGASAAVYDVDTNDNGDVYICGNFASWNSDSDAGYIAKFAGGAWSAVSTDAQFTTTDFPIVMKFWDGSFYVGSQASGSNATVKKWSGTAWSTLITTNGTQINDIVFDHAGNMYFGGDFTTANSVTVNYVGKYTSSGNVVPLGVGMTGEVFHLAMDKNDTLIIGTLDTWIADYYTAGKWWNGYSKLDFPVATTDQYEICAYTFDGQGNEYFGLEAVAGISSSVPALNTVTNNGTARVYPKLVALCSARDSTGAAKLKYLENVTTGKRILMDYNLQAGEELTLNFDPQEAFCESNTKGTRWDAVLRGSDISDFYLLPGTNNISFYLGYTTDVTITSYLIWRNRYESADGGSTA